MPKEKVSALLQQLQEELEQHESLSDEHKERISQLMLDIEQGLKDQSISDELNDSINDAITEFEVKNPRLTAIINDIMVTLSNIGI